MTTWKFMPNVDTSPTTSDREQHERRAADVAQALAQRRCRPRGRSAGARSAAATRSSLWRIASEGDDDGEEAEALIRKAVEMSNAARS